MGERHRILTTAPGELDAEFTSTLVTYGRSDRGKLLRLVEVVEAGNDPFYPRTQSQANRYVADFNLAKIDPSEDDIVIVQQLLHLTPSV